MELMDGNQVADIKLMQMFPWFGVIKNAKDEMSLMAKAKYETFVDAKLQVFYEVQTSWLDLYKVRRNIEISSRNIELLKTIERLSLAKFRSGASNNASGPEDPACQAMEPRQVQEAAVVWAGAWVVTHPVPTLQLFLPIKELPLP